MSATESTLVVGVLGLWHLGSVTAAACASVGHRVVGIDPNANSISGLKTGQAPIAEPGLNELIAAQLASGRLSFQTTDAPVPPLDVLWVAFDTPVDDDDNADVAYVIEHVQRVVPKLSAGAVVLVSSQMPIGSAKLLAQWAAAHVPEKQLEFAVSPENLRLGSALKVFLQPDRIVIGCSSPRAKAVLTRLAAPITDRVEWMSPESAEMSKHAINSFLAISVTFANEIAILCEKFGADAKDVERSLKSESRIGPKAYVGPGAAFAGGTLARDIAFLNHLALERGLTTPVLGAVRSSNNAHRAWARNKLSALLGDLSGKTVAIWGLTYKPGTDTLRRSMAVELVDWLLTQGAVVQVHDPAVTELPASWSARVTRTDGACDAVVGAEALVLCTPWPVYRTDETREALGQSLGSNKLIVIDADRSLIGLKTLASIDHHAVGTPE